jgi:hypothetical protein
MRNWGANTGLNCVVSFYSLWLSISAFLGSNPSMLNHRLSCQIFVTSYQHLSHPEFHRHVDRHSKCRVNNSETTEPQEFVSRVLVSHFAISSLSIIHLVTCHETRLVSCRAASALDKTLKVVKRLLQVLVASTNLPVRLCLRSIGSFCTSA